MPNPGKPGKTWENQGKNESFREEVEDEDDDFSLIFFTEIFRFKSENDGVPIEIDGNMAFKLLTIEISRDLKREHGVQSMYCKFAF